MLGKAYCPHCDASFNIGQAQLETDQGLVRCGRCLQIFDVRAYFVANQPHPQLELPILAELDFTTDQTASHTTDEAGDNATDHLSSLPDNHHIIGYSDFNELPENDNQAIGSKLLESEIIGNSHFAESPEGDNPATAYVEEMQPAQTNKFDTIEPELADEFDIIETLLPAEDTGPDSSHPAKALVIKPAMMAEEPREIDYEFSRKPRMWPWTVAACVSLLVLLVQAVYLFRVDLAASFPVIKPVLASACKILKCNVPLPQNANLMSIESSGLADAPQNHVVLEALLRNHAAYAQAFPNLELTLTDNQDSPLARRIFKPADYLSPAESEATGLLPNHEINIKLHLDTMDIKPSGYRLMLLYPQ
jgi:predicted Zn finger-like uncharacterized protein